MNRSRAVVLLCVIAVGEGAEARRQATPNASPVAAARPLPSNINDFRPAGRDALAGALKRLARGAIAADLSAFEPWLFDRATSYYKLSLWTGDPELKRHALTLVERYYALIDDRGEFTLKPGDAKVRLH